MPDVFELDRKELKRLEKFYKNAPKKAAKASASVMNRMTFVTRQIAMQQLNKSMTIRNPRFMSRQLKFTKAKVAPISSQFAEVGSVFAENFSGWNEQELGTKTKRTRVQSVIARSGSKSKQVSPSARMKPGKRFGDAQDIYGPKPKTDGHRLFVLYQVLKRKGKKVPFIISRRMKGFGKGLYKMRRKKIVKLQDFEPANQQPKKVKWMTSTLNVLKRSINLKQEWGKALERVLKTM